MSTVTHDDSTWNLESHLGKGLSGEVRMAVRVGDERKFAIKVVDFPALVAVFRDFDVTADTLESNLMREIEVMRRLRHRNIIYLDSSFWIDSKLYMVMELVEGKDLLRSITPGGLKEEVAKDYFFQLCSAISFCHSNNVIHGDLKPENVLIREKDHRLKLIDFGFSHIVKPGERLEVIGGTVLYSPPDDPEMSFAFDDWSCGIILFAMLSCSLPFPEADLSAKKHLTLNIPENITDDAVDIIVGLLNPVPRGRLSVSDVLASAEWLDSERCKELPETVTTLTLARQMSRPRVSDVPTLPISRQPSEMPLVEHEKDVKVWGKFLQRIKGPKSKSKGEVVVPTSRASEKRRDSTFAPPEKTKSVDLKSSGSETGMATPPPNTASFFSRSPPTGRSPPTSRRSPPPSSRSPLASQLSDSPSPKNKSPQDKKERRRSFMEKGSDSESADGSDKLPKGLRGAEMDNLTLHSDSDSDTSNPNQAGKNQSSGTKKMITGMVTGSMDEVPTQMDASKSPPKAGRRLSLLPGPKLPSFQKKIPPPSHPTSVTDSPSKRIFMKGSKSNFDFDDDSTDSKSDVLHKEKGLKERIGENFGRRRSLSHSQDDGKFISQNSNSDPSIPPVSDVDFVLSQLKAFEGSEKKLVDSLNRLFQFHDMVVQEAILSPPEAADLIPPSLKEIKSIHQSVFSTMQSLFGESAASQRTFLTMTDVGCTLEAVLSILASDRTYTSYIAYAREYPNSVRLLRILRRKGVSFAHLGADLQEIYSTLELPLNRLGEYGTSFAAVFDDLDDRAKRSLVSSMKLLDTLFRKCRAKAMPKIYC